MILDVIFIIVLAFFVLWSSSPLILSILEYFDDKKTKNNSKEASRRGKDASNPGDE